MLGWEGVGLGSSAIQFFAVWIAMQFLHACRLSLFLQFQAVGWTRSREVPKSRAKGSTNMGGGWQSKRVKPTSPAKLQHLVVPTRSKSQHAQGEQSPMRDWSREDDLSHAKEETPPLHQQNDQTCEGWYYLRHVYKSSHTIWYPCYFSNNLNVLKLCSTIGKKSEEVEASN
jgi:hypothetical protein